MTVVSQMGILPWVGQHYVFSGFTNFTINATNDKVYWLLQAPEAATITHLGFRYGVRTGTPVQHKISVQGIDASGLADGTILGGASPASGLFTPPASTAWNSLWQWIALDNSIALTRGQFIAIVIEPIGTPDGSNNSSFTYDNSGETGSGTAFPTALTIDGGAAAVRSTNGPMWGMKSALRSYGHPYVSIYQTSAGSGNEQAARFNIAGPVGGTYKVAGIRLPYVGLAATSFSMNLYSGTTVIQGPVTFDGDLHTTAANIRVWDLFFTDTNLRLLYFGQTYRLSIKSNDAGTMVWYGVTYNSSGDVSASLGGATMLSSTRSGGAWTDDDTKRMLGQLLLEDVSGPPSVLVNAAGLIQ